MPILIIRVGKIILILHGRTNKETFKSKDQPNFKLQRNHNNTDLHNNNFHINNNSNIILNNFNNRYQRKKSGRSLLKKWQPKTLSFKKRQEPTSGTPRLQSKILKFKLVK